MTANWFVPCRRAVMTSTISYHALIDAWCAQLEQHEAVMRRWYGLTGMGYDLALGTVRHWQASFFPEAGAIAAVRDGEVTLDSVSLHYKPRLWKGPQRVLREAPFGPDEAGAVVFDPLETVDPPLLLSDAREIENPEAPLLMGDVVELPLFRFLVMAGRGDYGAHSFHPDGSYLLGTSLSPDGDESPPLHDNLVAMRFQVLLGCMVGSFYHHAPVIDHSRAVSAAISAPIAPPPAPASDPWEVLRVEAQRVYREVSYTDRSLFKQELVKIADDPRWAKVDGTTRSRLTQWASQDWSGHPPPRAFLWRISDRFETLAKKSSLSASQRAEAEVLQELHQRVIARIQGWVMELDELLRMPEWGQVAVESRLPSMVGELAAARSVGLPCPWMCQREHSRMEVSELVKALRETVDALERRGVAPSGGGGAASGPAIYARGMLYAATLYCAADRWWYKSGPEAWHFYTNQWGRDAQGRIPTCLPYRSSLARLPRDQPVTPGSVCSDTTLLLLNYMIRNHGKAGQSSWGKGSVGASMRAKDKGTRYGIHDYYEYVPAKEVATWAPEITREERLARLDGLIEKVRELRRNVDSSENYWTVLHEVTTGADARWGEVGPNTRARLPRYARDALWGNGPPYGYLYYLSVGLKAHSGAAYDLLVSLNDQILGATTSFSQQLEALIQDPDWKAFEEDGFDFAKRSGERERISSIPPGGLVGRYGSNHELARKIGYAVRLIRLALDKKLAGLEKIAAKPDKIKGSVGGRRDLSTKLGDVNNVSFSGHEWAIVRVRDADDLLASAELPRAGFISAFNPLSGRSYFDSTSHRDGQFYVFEQRADLDRFVDSKTGRRHVYLGAAPFVWEKVPGNEFNIMPSGSQVKFTEPGRSTKKQLNSITRLVDYDGMVGAHEQGPIRPLFIHPTSKPSPADLAAKRATAYERLVTNGSAMYASRSLPYPTLSEARHAFASWDEVDKHLRALGV